MIEKHCFEHSWILKQREKLGGADPTLLEKTILAFELLGQLSLNGLSFVFKGGTSLLMLVDDFKRLSIDVDIFCKEDKRKLKKIFNQLIVSSPFSYWVKDHRTSSQIPKNHYKFFFRSQINQREDYVLLDILRSDNLYPRLQEKSVEFPFIHSKEKISISVPSVDGLIGDKLTAFAPRTIGVPLDEKRSMQIVKQLFDLGELFIKAKEMQEISLSYTEFAKMENRYRKTKFNNLQSLQDTLNACFMITQLDLKGSIENETTSILRKGIRQISSHLIGTPFGLQQAKNSAARVAFLAALLIAGNKANIADFIYDNNSIEEIREATLSQNFSPVNRLKGSAPEVFYYWYKINNFINNVEYD